MALQTTWLCIEFTKTRGWRARDRTDDELADYAALVRWLERAGAVSPREARRLRALAGARPGEARRMLEHGRALRAAIYGLLSRIGDGAAPRRTDVAALNRWIASTAPHRALVPGARAFSWRWRDGGQAGLERALWPVVQSTVDLLTSDALARVKRCDADDCGWLFVDASKNRSRRWCAMRECGNLAKVRRFRARRRKR